MRVEAIICTAALAIVAIACLAHLKAMGRAAPLCERLGFSITFGGAIGSALEWWWPKLETLHGDEIFIVGCGVIALSMLVRHFRVRIAVAMGRWDGAERRLRPRSYFQNELPTADPFLDSRFNSER